MIWTHLQEDTQFVGHFLFHFVLFDFRMRGGRRFESLNSQTRRDTAFLSSALQWRRLKPSVQPRGSWCASPRGITLTYPSHPTSNHSSPQDGTMTALIRLHLISIAKGQHYLSRPTFIFSVNLPLLPGLFLSMSLTHIMFMLCNPRMFCLAFVNNTQQTHEALSPLSLDDTRPPPEDCVGFQCICVQPGEGIVSRNETP